jgi:monoamine oxidase
MDTIVIGGGLAGLAAADRLLSAGRTVMLLESRPRLGGRVWTLDGELPVDLGAEWIGPDGAIPELLREGGARLVEAEGRGYRRRDRRWERLDSSPHLVRDLVERAAALEGGDRSLRRALAECCAEPASAERREQLLRYVEGFHAADPDRVSARWLAEVEAGHSAETAGLRSPEGAGRAVDALVARIEGRCEIRLEAVAREVRWRPGAVEVETAGPDPATFRARSAVISVPLPVLAPAPGDPQGLRCAPALGDKREAARLLEMGKVLKLVLGFRDPFWRDLPALDDMLFLHAYDEPIPTWWTPVSPSLPMITGWAGGPRAARLAGIPEHELLHLATGSLARALALPRRDVAERLEWHRFHDWSADRFARGAYSYVGVGGQEAHRRLARPVADTLYFAGEATCGEGLNATMEGAVRSGRRAAEELLNGRPGR